VIALSGTASALLQPVVASLADSSRRCSLRTLVQGLGALIAVLGACIAALSAGGGSRMVVGILYGGCFLLLQLAFPLVNALGMDAINQGRSLNWGAARGVGSVSYAAVSWLLRILSARIGTITVPLLIVLSFAAFLAVTFAFPGTAPQTSGAEASAQTAAPAAFFRKYPRFGSLLIGTTLLYMGHMILSNYTFQILQSKGGGSAEMGIANALAAFLEIPTMCCFGWMLKRASSGTWLRLSGVFLALKAVLSWLVPTVPMFYAVQVLQMFGWALISVAAVYYVNSIMEKSDAVKGQSYLTMTYTLGNVLGSLAGGQLLDLAGVRTVLIFMTVVTFAGMLVVLAAARKTRQN